MIGQKNYSLAKELWPINRSITGEGVRKTLSIIKKIIPDLKIFEVKSGTKAFDWTVPLEWRVKMLGLKIQVAKKFVNLKK